jgi:hypothetical protein
MVSELVEFLVEFKGHLPIHAPSPERELGVRGCIGKNPSPTSDRWDSWWTYISIWKHHPNNCEYYKTPWHVTYVFQAMLVYRRRVHAARMNHMFLTLNMHLCLCAYNHIIQVAYTNWSQHVHKIQHSHIYKSLTSSQEYTNLAYIQSISLTIANMSLLFNYHKSIHISIWIHRKLSWNVD